MYTSNIWGYGFFLPVFACTSYEPHETLVETGNAHHPTRTRTLWGDRCLDAVACQGYRLIWPARMLFLEGLEVYSIGGRPAEGMLCLGAVPWKDMESKLVNSYPIIGTFIIIHHQHAIATTALSGSSGETTDRLLNVADVAAKKRGRRSVVAVF